MILLCEIGFSDGTHVPFNAGLLATVREAFPKEELSFFGSPAHIAELKHQVGQQLASATCWKEIVPPSPGTVYLRRFFRELRIVRSLFRNYVSYSTSRLIFTSAYPSTVLALKVARLFRFNRTPVQIVLHGLSGVVGKRYRRPIRRFQDMKTALTLLGNQQIQYLVLEESIRDTVVKNLPLLSGNVQTLEHPIPPNEGPSETVDLSEPIRFGFLGLALKTKGFPVFVKLAIEITEKYGKCAEFHAIGRFAEGSLPVIGMERLATKPVGPDMMSRANFVHAIAPLHFILLLHEAPPYTLAASGILLDAIAWEKPVIARKIPIFEEMFEKHGEIGYLFSDEKELGKIVEQLFEVGDKLRYHRQVLNLRVARKSRAPQTLASAYRKCVEQVEGY
jgi:hypothetical protein